MKSSPMDPANPADSEEERTFWDHGWRFRLLDRIPDGRWFRGSITVVVLIVLFVAARGWPTDVAELGSTALWIVGTLGVLLILVTPAALWMRASSKKNARSARNLRILAVVAGVAAVSGVVFGLWILGDAMGPGQRSFGETLWVGVAILIISALLWPGTWFAIVAFPFRAIGWTYHGIRSRFLRRRARLNQPSKPKEEGLWRPDGEDS